MDGRVAELTWKPSSEGGPPHVPNGPTFFTVARFEAQGAAWREQAWTLMVTLITLAGDDRRHRVYVRFLVEDGPEEWLTPGARFWLREGPREVAEGRVLLREELYASTA